jgi:hypothetical protein
LAICITLHDEGDAIRVRAEGRLDADAVADLLATCREAGAGLRLDLAGLLSADGAGIRALRDLVSRGVPISGASPYVRCLLDAE